MNAENYNLAICDDEVYWQKELFKYCKAIEEKKEIKFTYHFFLSGEELLEFKGHLDILLLDEEMKKISGQMIKEHFESINRDTMIIFVTTHNEIIYDSFGKNVYGFLEKPIVENSFFGLFERILIKLNRKQYMTFNDSINGKIIIPCTDIIYMEADGGYTKVYFKNHDRIIMRRGLNEIEKANQFLNEDLIYFRNNKSNTNEYRLNIPYITAMSVSNTNSVMEYVNFIYSSNTNSANNINSMAWVLVYLEIDIDRGIELAKNAIKKESKSSHYLDTLGFGYYKKKNYDGALKQLLKAALYVDDNSKAEIYLHIADAYYDKNDLKNALKYYRKSISSLYKDFIFINFEEDRIKKRIEFINNKLKN